VRAVMEVGSIGMSMEHFRARAEAAAKHGNPHARLLLKTMEDTQAIIAHYTRLGLISPRNQTHAPRERSPFLRKLLGRQ